MRPVAPTNREMPPNRPATDDAPSLDAVIREHRAFIGRILRRCAVPERDLPDVEQDVFLVVLRRLAEFEGRSSLRTWLCRIAFNVASDYRRRACNRREMLSSADESQLPASGDSGAEQRDLLRQLSAAIEQLSDDKREVFVLRELEELPMTDIARRLHVPLKTAFSRLYHARRELRAQLLAGGYSFGVLPLLWPGRWLPRSFASSGASVRMAAQPSAAWHAPTVAKLGLALTCALVATVTYQSAAAPDPIPSAVAQTSTPAPSAPTVVATTAEPPSAASVVATTAEPPPSASGAARRDPPVPASARASRARRPRNVPSRNEAAGRDKASPPNAREATIIETDLTLYRMSGAEPSAPIQLPFGFEIVPEPPAPKPIHISGPPDAVSGVEQALP